MSILAYFNPNYSDGLTAIAGLGDELETSNGARWKYLKASGAIARYALCHVTAANLAIEATTTLVGTAARPTLLCIPQTMAAIADLEYFWAPIGPFGPFREDGVTTYKVLAANAATSVRLYTTGTAGVVDDAVTTGNVAGLALTETVTTQEAADCVAVTRLVSFCEL